ncbi:pentapeptide repeat-containing protein [Micromonospora sp. WMMA1998]|uniref:pentapeptide repeat-containing protein n=1 Tax=Micromonospora sp. WMMA1998 TaxID=3015167 RepID=UPI00248C2F0C|nr:pentapeptide repeat-containing protein [Micromonospora sp. WMMA1998]WBC17741.1 pentapeptide repeat-containing protein [Micromonospora sp. WMMA1998]
MIAVLAGFVATAAGVSAYFLLSLVKGVGSQAEEARLQIEAIKTGLTVGAGTGGALALLLTARKQWLSEREHLLQIRTSQVAERDAEERRITDLYAKAAELLGHDRPSARIAALYALSRLGENNPTHRNTVVNLICGYLRLAPPVDLAQASPWSFRDELEVRYTAQRILKRHLAGGDDAARWESVELDLTGATLYDFDVEGCRLKRGVFRGCIFQGHSKFSRVRIAEDTRFEGANFAGQVEFAGAILGGHAYFDESEFHDEADFRSARFEAGASFDNSLFGSAAAFVNTQFGEHVEFYKATFKGGAFFNRASFNGGGLFDHARFYDFLGMVDTKCRGKIRFIGADFFSFFDLGDNKFYELYNSRVWFSEPDLGVMALCPPPGWDYGECTDGYHPLVPDRSENV